MTPDMAASGIGQKADPAAKPKDSGKKAPSVADSGSNAVVRALSPKEALAQDQGGQDEQGGQQEQSGEVPPDWDALQRKEEQLKRREESLRTLEKEVDAKLERVQRIQADIKQMIEEAKSIRDRKFKHLIDVYSSMKAQNAAQALSKLDEDTAVKILAGMRGRSAGEILNNVAPEKAARLSEALTEMQIPFQDQ
jgi:flagellar motility protein MotE (MotC chaperone)